MTDHQCSVQSSQEDKKQPVMLQSTTYNQVLLMSNIIK